MNRKTFGTALIFATVILGFMTSCDKKQPKKTPKTADVGKVVKFTLEARITGYIGKGGKIDGKKNPVLNVNRGDKVSIKLVNAENMAHDLRLDVADKGSKHILKVGEVTTFTFVAEYNDSYFCSLPGHRQAGMLGRLKVKGAKAAPSQKVGGTVPKELKAVKKFDVAEIGRDAADVPKPINRKAAKAVELTIKTTEVVGKLEDGTSYTYWTFDNTVPGPMIRVREGDTVTLHVDNDPKSTMVHSVDLHAVTGPGGGAAVLQVPPGKRRTLTFTATHTGLYVYHCATPHIPTHLARGMYGLILVEPKKGLPAVDKEFYIMQGDLYTAGKPGSKGHQTQDDDRLFEERATYVVFNGRVGSLTGSRALKAKVGETIRIYFGVGGPNTVSAFHIIGEIFDKVYPQGSLISPPLLNVQTTLVPPGGATIVEFKVDYPGKYIIVDHALTRMDKGAVGIITVEGKKNEKIFKPHGQKSVGH